MTAAVIARVVAPLVNPNEPESQVIELGVGPFAQVARGQVLCVLETSKSTEEVEAETDGWIGPLHVALFDRVEAGAPICEIYDGPPARAGAADAAAPSPDGAPAPRMTKKAEALAQQLGVDPALLPTDRFVTERDVRAAATAAGAAPELPSEIAAAIDARAVAIFGGGGFGRALIDTLRAGERLRPLCVVDDNLPPGEDVLGVPVVGGRAYLAALAGAGLELAVNAVGAIGRIQSRIDVSAEIEAAGLRAPTLRDPSATIAASAEIAEGAQILQQAVVWAAARVGRGTIVNTGAIVSHDCRVGDHVHLAPGAILAGHVEVGDATLVGMAVTTRPGLRIGARCIVGNGATLTEDVPEGTIVHAGSVWPR